MQKIQRLSFSSAISKQNPFSCSSTSLSSGRACRPQTLHTRFKRTWETLETLERYRVWSQAVESFSRDKLTEPVKTLVTQESCGTRIASLSPSCSNQLRDRLRDIQATLDAFACSTALWNNAQATEATLGRCPSKSSDTSSVRIAQLASFFHTLRQELNRLFRLPLFQKSACYSEHNSDETETHQMRRIVADTILHFRPELRLSLRFITENAFSLPLKLVADATVVMTLLYPPEVSMNKQRILLDAVVERTTTELQRLNSIALTNGNEENDGCYAENSLISAVFDSIIVVTKALVANPVSLQLLQPPWLVLMDMYSSGTCTLESGLKQRTTIPCTFLSFLETFRFLNYHDLKPTKNSFAPCCLSQLLGLEYEAFCAEWILSAGTIWDIATPRELVKALYLTSALLKHDAEKWEQCSTMLVQRLSNCTVFLGIPHALYVPASYVAQDGCRLSDIECRDVLLFLAHTYETRHPTIRCPLSLLKRLENITAAAIPHSLPVDKFITTASMFRQLRLRNSTIRDRFNDILHQGQFLRIAPDLFLDLLSQSQFFLVTPSERANAFVFQYIQQNASSFTAVQLLLLIPLLPPYVATDSKRLDILESFIKSASAMCFTLIVDDALAAHTWLLALDALKTTIALFKKRRTHKPIHIATELTFQLFQLPLCGHQPRTASNDHTPTTIPFLSLPDIAILIEGLSYRPTHDRPQLPYVFGILCGQLASFLQFAKISSRNTFTFFNELVTTVEALTKLYCLNPELPPFAELEYLLLQISATTCNQANRATLMSLHLKVKKLLEAAHSAPKEVTDAKTFPSCYLET